MYTEDQLLALSAVSQYVHCPRRCALVYLEQAWTDNIFTAEGTVLHEKVDSGKSESRGNIKIIRSLRLRSLRLGITGIADVVEFHRCSESENTDDAVCSDEMCDSRMPASIQKNTIPAKGWKPFPVEYKRGASKDICCYEVQLCAQALCLEEMLGVSIPGGALFLGEKQHRTPVIFDDKLRSETESVCIAIHELFAKGVTPPADYNKRCSSCSLLETCLPKSGENVKSARKWLDRQLDEIYQS